MKLPIGVQVYTVRDVAEKDLFTTLEQISKIGYDGVEFAGYYGLDVSKIKKKIDSLGLVAFGTHNGYKDCVENLDKLIEQNQILGSKYLVCPGGVKFETKEDYQKTAEIFNKIGSACKDNGVIFGYHNHSHEFETYDGEYGLDILYKNSDPNLVKVELDAGWAMDAGADEVAYLKKYKGRCPLIHLKDFLDDGTQTEVGCGNLDVKGLIKSGMEGGSEYLIVEQDTCKIPSIESIEISYNNTKKVMESI